MVGLDKSLSEQAELGGGESRWRSGRQEQGRVKECRSLGKEGGKNLGGGEESGDRDGGKQRQN